MQPLGVFQHQRHLGDYILEVVHDKGGGAVECVELSNLEQGLVHLHLRKPAGCLATGGLEQVVDLPIDVNAGTRMREHHEADQLATDSQRNQQASLRHGLQPVRQHQVAVARPVGLVLVEIDDPAAGRHEADKRRTSLLEFQADRHVPTRGLPISTRAAVLYPKTTSRTVQHVGKAANHAFAHTMLGMLARQGVGEAKPFHPVVVAVAEKVLSQHHPQGRPHSARHGQHRQRHQTQKHHRNLECPSPFAAKVADIVGDAGQK